MRRKITVKDLNADIARMEQQRDQKIAEVNVLQGGIEYAKTLLSAISVPGDKPVSSIVD